MTGGKQAVSVHAWNVSDSSTAASTGFLNVTVIGTSPAYTSVATPATVSGLPFG